MTATQDAVSLVIQHGWPSDDERRVVQAIVDAGDTETALLNLLHQRNVLAARNESRARVVDTLESQLRRSLDENARLRRCVETLNDEFNHGTTLSRLDELVAGMQSELQSELGNAASMPGDEPQAGRGDRPGASCRV